MNRSRCACGALVVLFAFVAIGVTACSPAVPVEVAPEQSRTLEDALARERGGDLAGAIELVRALVAQAPDYALAQLELARLVEAQGGEQALATHLLALEADPRARAAGLVVLADRETDLERKAEILARAVEAEPGLALAWARLGRARVALERWDDASDAFERACELDPGDAALAMEAAYVHVRRFDWPRALAGARAALLLDATNARAQAYVAVDHLIRRDYLAAIEHFRSWRRAGGAVREREERGVSYLAYRGALGRMRTRREVEPGFPLAREAVELYPDAAVFRDHLGYFAELSGDLELAERCYREALARDPFAMKPMQSLRRLMFKAGRHAEALVAWRRIVPLDLLRRPDNQAGPVFARFEAAVARAPAAEGASAADLRELMSAAAGAGFLEEALAVAARLDGDREAAAEAAQIAGMWTFLEALRERMGDHYRALERREDTLDLDGLGHWVREHWPLGDAPDLDKDLERYYVVVREAHPFREVAGSLAARLARYNLVLDTGDNAGYLDMRLSRLVFRGRCEQDVGGLPYAYTPLVTDETVVDTYMAYLSGHSRISGRAFLSRRGFYVALDTFRPGRIELQRFLREPRVRLPRSGRVCYDADLDRALRKGYLATVGLDYPIPKPDRETLDRVFQLYFAGALRNVWMHELGHLVDFEKYLPFRDHVYANVAVSVGCGLSPKGIVQRFERVAETFSVATTGSPFLSLQDNLQRLELDPGSLYYVVLVAWQKNDPRESPYYQGAASILGAMLDRAERLRGPGQPLAAIAELGEDEIRKVAREECRKEGIPFRD